VFEGKKLWSVLVNPVNRRVVCGRKEKKEEHDCPSAINVGMDHLLFHKINESNFSIVLLKYIMLIIQIKM